MNFPVFDLHCDTAYVLSGLSGKPKASLRNNDGHIDLSRASTLSNYAQCFACFTSPLEKYNPVDAFEKQLSTIIREIETNADLIRIAYNASDIDENAKNGIMSAILTIEGPAGFGFDPELLGDLYNVGFRITTLGWNENNPLTGSNQTGGGLTDLGSAYVREAQRLGMLVDVSHISDEGFWDIMDITQAPIVATHSNSRSICDVSRNLSDEMFLAICRTGGVAGINMYSAFVGEDPTLDRLCDHILHFMELDPSGKHISLGGDLDGCDTLCHGIANIADYPRIAGRLIERGLSEQTVQDIFWNNAMEVFKKCST
ncbi:MAG: membrane dipeptidase [Oscillospiraceae bacterium]|nr:membrane dipeptidase [Oscillospiraceae bacterium]